MLQSHFSFRLLLAICLALGSGARGAEEQTGEQIYRQLCAACHGPQGEGSALEYPQPLIGDHSVDELARIIDKTMPLKAPEKCVGDDAKKVAAYIHEAFYSPLAQARTRPARIELSRLTVRQYQNAVADLIETFRSHGTWGAERGLRGEYFKSRRMQDGERVINRLDPLIQFDFGENAPGPEKFEPREFSIRWEGSMLAPDTGDYEFIIQTEHAARLWINNPRRPLIDAWVKSGTDTEYRHTLHLLGGRAYPLKLEFSKGKQGVDDSNKNKDKLMAVKASIALLWKRPRQSAEVIPQHNLSPQRFPETWVVAAKFPPDDRSIGYERGVTISKEWDQAATDAAIETAGYLASHMNEFAGTRDDAGDRKDRLRDFCRRFVERAFRRPLADEQRKIFVDQQFEQAPDLENAVKRVVLLALKSPRFLYREVGGAQADAFDVASRISFGLWDSLPDQVLLDAAAQGRLATREQVAPQVERMAPDLRTRAKLREFFQQWLQVDRLTEVAKDRQRFPDFTPELASDLRTSLELFVEEIVWNDSSDFRRLLLADSLPLNGRLARFYGADLPDGSPFQQVRLDPGQRMGVLSHPFLLAGFAYTHESSPIHRGVFIARSLLGRTLRPPPEAVTPLPPELHADLSTRERVALQTSSANCLSCHGLINPLGFTLENFDAVGRYRSSEKDKPINTAGAYQNRHGQTAQFSGAGELAAYLAESEETHAAFVDQLFRFLIKQPIRAYGGDESANLRVSFQQRQFHIRQLAAEIVTRCALTGITAKP